MNKSRVASLAVLAYGGIFVLSAAEAPRNPAGEAGRQAERVVRALARHDFGDAVAAAEQAVRFAPAEAGYRLLLGQSYLQAGRFVSAGQAFADALTLDPGNGKAALNLALTQVAAGDWQAARQTLTAHGDAIPAPDRGLALALAGDTAGAVALLTEVARSPAASAKVRQNLALSYALAGQWQEARVVASADMSPADVDARMEQWAAFVQPRAASDQVASLLGVRPVRDGGQPTALALAAPAQVPSIAPVAVAREETAPIAAPVAAPVQVVTSGGVTFEAPREVVQPLPATLIERSAGPIRVAMAPRTAAPKPATAHRAAPASGQWYVQLGAYDNAGVAKDDWGRARKRYAAFGGHVPQGATIKVGQATYYRLSVGGFARADADKACRAYRARGGHCFVRMGAGEQVAGWVSDAGTRVAARPKAKGVQVASR